MSKLLFMVEFAYNNAKNTSTDTTSFELNCSSHFYVLYKKVVDTYSHLTLVKELVTKLE